jgi:Sensors of blue-light using FAD
MSSLVHCIYASTAVRPFNEAQLATLIQGARVKNESLGVTGILIYMSGRFLQILEGEATVVEQLYATIEHDQRHKEVTQIIFESIRAREFCDWSMSMIDLSGDKLRQLVLQADPTSGTLSISHLPNGRAKKLLLAFCEGRWGPTLADIAVAPIL